MMTRALRYLMAAILVGLAAAALAMAGLVERRMAEAERALGTLDLGTAARSFDAIGDTLRFTRWVPWWFDDTRRELEARAAEARYWRGDYAGLVTAYPELGRANVQDNAPLQLAVAGAHIRATEARGAADAATHRQALDRSIGIYLQVLRNTRGNRDAAYNYEVLVRRRQALAGGQADPTSSRATPLGNPGSAEDDDMDMTGDLNDIQIYVPSDMLGRESTDEPTIGSDAPLRRRG